MRMDFGLQFEHECCRGGHAIQYFLFSEDAGMEMQERVHEFIETPSHATTTH
jgi:hypothetical protein